MATNQIFIISGGILTLLMFIFHINFYRLFHWREVFQRIKEPNNRIFYTIHVALYALFIGMFFISMVYYRELADAQGLAQGVLLVFALFWLWRTIWQLIYFKPPAGKRQLHFILTIWFGLLFACYAWPLIF